ncbi:uncharacterized protein LOC124743698 [Schistocerca piceifrons]|uniref:uncharacterized protein LOC124743698 n=1 Tax=Schistocerca piceifrons TaxID=274613 RepID=UPI001F5EDD96|nr:uncharacterized protein LOC124743698 [Schistocerca piceifrons]XP_047104826.1 uncharacterized protein LOC124743698 [Schistocerca piceifrons]
MNKMEPEDPNEFCNFVGMDKSCYDKLLSFISDNICHKDTVMKESISPSGRLAVTLRFLATGESYKSLSFLHRIFVPSISHIIMQVCTAIRDVLKDKYLKAPTTEREWQLTADMFDELWQFPNCLGAMDGKHVAIAAPRSADSLYYNYKKFNSIVLLAIVDAKYWFSLIDIGCNG